MPPSMGNPGGGGGGIGGGTACPFTIAVNIIATINVSLIFFFIFISPQIKNFEIVFQWLIYNKYS